MSCLNSIPSAAPMEAPQQVTVSIIDDSTVELHWRGVYTTIEEEPLEGYIVSGCVVGLLWWCGGSVVVVW